MRVIRAVVVVLAAVSVVPAGLSAARAATEIAESELNAGGHPLNGANPQSACCVVTLGAIGGTLVSPRLTSASYALDGGIVALLPPAGEVRNLRFTAPTALAWDPERSAGSYALYRGDAASLPVSYGGCIDGGLTVPGTTDTDEPAAGTVYVYLVGVTNRIGETGGLGFDGDGNPRPAPGTCP